LHSSKLLDCDSGEVGGAKKNKVGEKISAHDGGELGVIAGDRKGRGKGTGLGGLSPGGTNSLLWGQKKEHDKSTSLEAGEVGGECKEGRQRSEDEDTALKSIRANIMG